MEFLSCLESWNLIFNSNSLNIDRIGTKVSTMVFFSQGTQMLLVTRSTGMVSIVPFGPAQCKKKEKKKERVQKLLLKPLLHSVHRQTSATKTPNSKYIYHFHFVLLKR